MAQSENLHPNPGTVVADTVSTRLRGRSSALAALFALHLLLVLAAVALNPIYYVTLASKSLVSCLFLATTVIACINMYAGAVMLGTGRGRGRVQMVFTGAFYGLLISAASWWPDNGAAMLGMSGLALTAAGALVAPGAGQERRPLSGNGYQGVSPNSARSSSEAS